MEKETSLVTTEQFGGAIQQHQLETASGAMASLARARVEASCIMAERHPRDMLDLRARLLKECARPGFASVARYSLPRWGKDPVDGQYKQIYIKGYTIRFAEAVARNIRNIGLEAVVVFEDDDKRVVQVTATDFESNYTTSNTISITKRTEKKSLKKGEKAISSRLNSYGETVYLLPATDDEIAMKQNSAISKARRNLILTLCPGDILDDCLESVTATLTKADSTDPAGALKKIVDAFARLNVLPSQLAEYLGHNVETASPAEVATLRGLFASLDEGALTWVDVMGKNDETDEATKARTSRVEDIVNKTTERLAERRKKPAPATVATTGTEVPEKPAQREPGED